MALSDLKLKLSPLKTWKGTSVIDVNLWCQISFFKPALWWIWAWGVWVLQRHGSSKNLKG